MNDSREIRDVLEAYGFKGQELPPPNTYHYLRDDGYSAWVKDGHVALTKPNGKTKVYRCSPASFKVALEYSLAFFDRQGRED